MTPEDVNLALRLQALWGGVDGRCNRPKHISFKDYGAKGITLATCWSGRKGMVRFINWCLSNGYQEGLDLDSIDNDQGYTPENCRFISHQKNCWNKSNNRLLTYKNETKCAAEWGLDPRCVVPQTQFQQRVNCGWDVERALTQPLRRFKNGTKTRKAS